MGRNIGFNELRSHSETETFGPHKKSTREQAGLQPAYTESIRFLHQIYQR